MAKQYQPEDFGPVKALNGERDQKALVAMRNTKIRD